MQKKKDEVKALIIKAAEKEFHEKGFQKATLRDIASSVGITKGNIYTYFKSKDQLFCELVQPSLKYIKESMKDNSYDEYVQDYIFKTEESVRFSNESFAVYVELLSDHSDDLKLLFFASPGSSMENFREEIFELYSETCRAFYRRMLVVVPGINFQFSEMLIHSMASMYLSLIEEIIVHNPRGEEMKKYIKQMGVFVYYGTINVIKSEINKEF